MMTSSEIRTSFLEFFKSKGHDIVPSSPVVLPADPTLMFVNAGMNPFKEIFLGARKSAEPRVANSQKCIRVSGKHNDLEEVGVDTYHHTFFEMLGNWSFGDYYKEEAITWAWELLTEVWKLPKERLWVTVYTDDDEAEALWKNKTDVNPSHILRCGDKDNFWEMGETGPCGPCSEIHIDLTEDMSGGPLVNEDSPEVIEIWNLVFIQYNRRSDRSLEELPSKHVDTGMGFERLAAVIQGKKSNYDTDIFMPLIEKVMALSGKSYEGKDAIAMRVIADHVRTLSIAIGDGVLPSNDGRGYVLRRILRRAVKYGRNLGLEEPFMTQLLPVLQKNMGDVYPALIQRSAEIERAIHAEEESFARTLGRGLELFEEAVKKASGKEFPGEEAFKLYDTFGFPLDLTILMASERGLAVDEAQFSELMKQQQERARGARKNATSDELTDLISDLVAQGVSSSFMGYTETSASSTILEIVVNTERVDTLVKGQEAALLVKQTPFYSEAGGQLGDTGKISGEGFEFQVTDTQKLADGIIFHWGTLAQGQLEKGASVQLQIDAGRRKNIEHHHTATHILNHALRELVSPDVKQAGSYVAEDRLRFDFNNPKAVDHATLAEIEQMVNDLIQQNHEVKTSEMALKDVEGSGIIAVFDEKYGDSVRVVDVGGYSRELCGGTHVGQTGEIGSFRIVSESSVAAGIRRIEACTGQSALKLTQSEHRILNGLSAEFKVKPEELGSRVQQLVKQNRDLQKQLKHNAAASAKEQVGGLVDQLTEVHGLPLLSVELQDLDIEGLRGVLDGLNQKISSAVIVLGSAHDGKAGFVASVSDDLLEKGLHAGKIVGAVAKMTQGGGGGKPGKAQAGGKDATKVPEAIAAIPKILSDLL